MLEQKQEKQFQHQVVRLNETDVNLEISPLFNFLIARGDKTNFLSDPKYYLKETEETIENCIRFFNTECNVNADADSISKHKSMSTFLYQLKDLFTNLTILK